MNAKNIESPVELMPLIRKVEEAIKRRVASGTKKTEAREGLPRCMLY